MSARARVFAPMVLVIATAVGCGRSEPASVAALATSPGGPLKVLSNRADLISGGDALVEVEVPAGIDVAQVHMDVSGRDVTTQFARRANGRFQGLVTGLALGDNVVNAHVPGGGGRITIVNHPIGGPVFSGPQVQPWYCLPDALDAQCNRPIVYDWQYKSSVTGKFAAYDPGNPPPDVATTTTDQGKTVPYIVREEAGTMDRSAYLIAVLADPAAPFDRWTGPPAWNHKVYVLHGGGCAGKHTEGVSPAVIDDGSLSRGFLVMSTALEDSNQDCNLVVQSESVMMAKEHVIEAYGDIRYVLGMGSSGGSLASLQMSNAYPGIYDGLIVGATFPDLTLHDLLDCLQMHRYFEDPRKWAIGVVWTEADEAAAESKQSITVCKLESLPFGPEDYSNMFNPSDPAWCDMGSHEPERVYNATSNPTGVRCAIQDYFVNILGTRTPEYRGPVEQQIGYGFANRPYDTLGVQYGWRALMAGSISPAQFADLNAKIGAVDIDYGSQPTRAVAEPAGLVAAYRSGMVNETNNLHIPIIDVPNAVDNYDIHDKWKSWALRARLDAANGNHDNHVLWFGPDEQGVAANAGAGFVTMDQWLTAIEQDTRDVPLEQKVREDKPEAAHDRCDLPDPDTCYTVNGPYGSIRYGSGAGIATDIYKCQLKPLARADYAPLTFTDDQWAQLQAAFPTGVCDWDQRGVEQGLTTPWMTYADGTGGKPLPPAPHGESF